MASSVVALAICKDSCGQVSVSGMSGYYVQCRVGIDWIPRTGVIAQMLALMVCQTKNLQYTCYRNYYYEIYTL